MRASIAVITIFALTSCSLSRAADESAQVEAELFEIERRSHERWLARDSNYLDRLMADTYRFIAMNGAIESKNHVSGRGADSSGIRQSPLRVQSLRSEPTEMVLEGNTAVVIGTLFIEATVGDRPLPNRMRSLSTFVRRGPGESWRLLARSITPILTPPR